MKLTFGLSVLSSALFQSSNGVLYGDEQFGDIEGGRFWAFHSAGVSIVNPESCDIEHTFTHDNDGNTLPNSWYDGVYMERKGVPMQTTTSSSSSTSPTTTADEMKPTEGYVVINSGVTTFDSHENLEGGSGEVLVFSTDPKKYTSNNKKDIVVSKVTVGGRPVHSYAVYPRDEFWTHSDADGFFYIIDLDDLDEHTGKPVKAKVAEANHGKLLWDEDSHLAKHGFATTTGEQHLMILDMDAHEQIGTYNFADDVQAGTCSGTHAIAYSSQNQHLYLECSGGGGTLEVDVSSPEQPTFVRQHLDATGALYETPDEEFVIASDKGGNALHLFRPQGTGSESSIEYVINVPGHPSTPSFWMDEVSGDYIACMPLTENTNRNHMDSNGSLVCDAYGCSGAQTKEDVANGICHYDASGRLLQEATLDQINDVKQGVAPFGETCDYCKNDKNYNDDGVCECTPFCGSCADEDYDATNSGVRCVSFGDILAGDHQSSKLVRGAGSVYQGQPYAYSPQCGFGRTYRTHKRGGVYDASVANFPTNSIQVVNMRTQTLKCAVDLPGAPSRVIYVPPQPGQNKSDKLPLSKGAIVAISAAAMIAFLLLGVFIGRRRRRHHGSVQYEHGDKPSETSGVDNSNSVEPMT